MSMSDENRPNPRSEADHVIYQVVLPIWDELYGHDFWGDGNFDAFYELPDRGPPQPRREQPSRIVSHELDEDNVRIGPAVSVAWVKPASRICSCWATSSISGLRIIATLSTVTGRSSTRSGACSGRMSRLSISKVIMTCICATSGAIDSA